MMGRTLTRYILISLMLLSDPAGVMAQRNKWGLCFGWNFMQYTVQSEGHKGINAGFFYEAKLGKQLLLGTGFEFNSFGARGSRGGVSYKDHLHYLSVPLKLQYFPTRDGKISFDAGMLTGYVIGKSVGNIAGPFVAASDISSFETGFLGGLTAYMVKDIRVGAYYYRGLADISLSPSYQFYNKGLRITAGLNF